MKSSSDSDSGSDDGNTAPPLEKKTKAGSFFLGQKNGDRRSIDIREQHNNDKKEGDPKPKHWSKQAKPFKCELCPVSYKTENGWIRHSAEYHQLVIVSQAKSLNYCCQSCGCSYKFKRSLNTHFANKHGREKSKGPKPQISLPEGNLKHMDCETCNNYLVQIAKSRRHIIATHNLDRAEVEEWLTAAVERTSLEPFKCGICNFTTYLKKLLETHVSAHVSTPTPSTKLPVPTTSVAPTLKLPKIAMRLENSNSTLVLDQPPVKKLPRQSDFIPAVQDPGKLTDVDLLRKAEEDHGLKFKSSKVLVEQLRPSDFSKPKEEEKLSTHFLSGPPLFIEVAKPAPVDNYNRFSPNYAVKMKELINNSVQIKQEKLNEVYEDIPSSSLTVPCSVRIEQEKIRTQHFTTNTRQIRKENPDQSPSGSKKAQFSVTLDRKIKQEKDTEMLITPVAFTAAAQSNNSLPIAQIQPLPSITSTLFQLYSNFITDVERLTDSGDSTFD